MFHRTLLDPQLSPHFSTLFLHLHSPTTSPSLLYPSASPSTATLQRGLRFSRLAEQSPLSKSLIEVSSGHTPINLPSKWSSLDTNLDDLATVDFTTVLSGARSKCYPIHGFQFSGTFKRGETHAGRGSVERPLSKGLKKPRIGKWTSFPNGKGKNSVRTEKLSRIPKRKLIKLFKDNLMLRQDYLKRGRNWTEENGKGEMLIFLSMTLACSSNPRGWN